MANGMADNSNLWRVVIQISDQAPDGQTLKDRILNGDLDLNSLVAEQGANGVIQVGMQVFPLV